MIVSPSIDANEPGKLLGKRSFNYGWKQFFDLFVGCYIWGGDGSKRSKPIISMHIAYDYPYFRE